MIIYWALYQGYFYSQIWGIKGWFIGIIFFVPLTLNTLFQFVILKLWLSFFGVLVYLSVAMYLGTIEKN